jgi:hypothetical protein
MAKPILDGPRIMAGVRQSEAACVAAHVAMDREADRGLGGQTLYMAVQGLRRERRAAF